MRTMHNNKKIMFRRLIELIKFEKLIMHIRANIMTIKFIRMNVLSYKESKTCNFTSYKFKCTNSC